MKKLIIFLMLLGVVTLEAKPKYRIETWYLNGQKQYLAQRKVWASTNYFPLPYKIWVSGAYPFNYQSQAEDVIRNWEESEQNRKKNKKSEFIYTN
jgi:hypothetical protein